MIDSKTSLILGEGDCRYAFFPGCCLCENEPEIVVKIYDSLRFQKPDTALLIMHCGDIEKVRAAWNELGRPELILCCPRCGEAFSRNLPDIPAASLYDKLIEYGISGGCNSVDYCLHESVSPAVDTACTAGDAAIDPVGAGASEGAVKQLAEDMGVKLHSYEKNSPFPYLVNDIAIRNELKSSNCDAAHILELIFGMGASNTHLIHEHEHDHENEHEHERSREHERDRSGAAPDTLPDENQRQANLEELVQVLKALYL